MAKPTPTLSVYDLRQIIENYAQMTAITERRITEGKALTSCEQAALLTASHRVMGMLAVIGGAVEKARIPHHLLNAATEELNSIRRAARRMAEEVR